MFTINIKEVNVDVPVPLRPGEAGEDSREQASNGKKGNSASSTGPRIVPLNGGTINIDMRKPQPC